MTTIIITKKMASNFNAIYAACNMVKGNKGKHQRRYGCVRINNNHLYATNGKVLFWIDLENTPEIEEDLPESFYKVLTCNKKNIILQKTGNVDFPPNVDGLINFCLNTVDKIISLNSKEELSEFTLITQIPLAYEFYRLVMSTDCYSASFKDNNNPVVFYGHYHQVVVMPMTLSPREITKIK